MQGRHHHCIRHGTKGLTLAAQPPLLGPTLVFSKPILPFRDIFSVLCFSGIAPLRLERDLLVAPSCNVTPIHAYLSSFSSSFIPFHSQISRHFLPQNVHATQQPSCFVVNHQQRACSFQAWPVSIYHFDPRPFCGSIRKIKIASSTLPSSHRLVYPQSDRKFKLKQQICGKKSLTLLVN